MSARFLSSSASTGSCRTNAIAESKISLADVSGRVSLNWQISRSAWLTDNDQSAAVVRTVSLRKSRRETLVSMSPGSKWKGVGSRDFRFADTNGLQKQSPPPTPRRWRRTHHTGNPLVTGYLNGRPLTASRFQSRFGLSVCYSVAIAESLHFTNHSLLARSSHGSSSILASVCR